MLKHILQSLVGVVSSMFGTVIIFIIAGRSLGPSDFGHFSIAYAICSLFGIALDFGYMTKLLRDANSNNNAGQISLTREAIALKFILLIALSIILLCTSIVSALPLILTLTFWSGISCISIANMLGTTLKAAGYHLLDAKNILFANICAVCAAVIFYTYNASIVFFALVVVVTGLVQLTLTVLCWSKIGTISNTSTSAEQIIKEFKTGFSYFLDALSQRGFGFVDVMILGLVATPATVGIYQASQKIALAANVFSQPFNNVFTPKLSQSRTNRRTFSNLGTKVLLVQTVAGVCALVSLTFLGPTAIDYLYSREYAEGKSLMVPFGILVAVRYVAASQTLQITALGLQRRRTIINILGLLLFAGLAYPLGSSLDSFGIILSSVVASSVIGISAWILRKNAIFSSVRNG